MREVAHRGVRELLQSRVGRVPADRLVVAAVEPLELGVGQVGSLAIEPFEPSLGIARQQEDPAVALDLHGARADAGGAELVEEADELGGQELAPVPRGVTSGLVDLVLVGVGLGLFVPLVNLATGSVEEQDTGLASGLMTTCQQVGGALGIAVLVTIVSPTTAHQLAANVPPPQSLVDGFSAAFHIQAPPCS